MMGTLQWMAPEVKSRGYGKKVDVYSFALVMWELLTCRIPWSDDDRFHFAHYVIVAVNKGERPRATQAELEVAPAAFVDLMRECWSMDAEDRPTFGRTLRRLQGIQKALT